MCIIYVLCPYVCLNCVLFFSGPIKEDSKFKDDEDPSVDYVDIIGTEEQLVSILLGINHIINNKNQFLLIEHNK